MVDRDGAGYGEGKGEGKGILCIDHIQTPGHCLATVSNCRPQTESATFHGEGEKKREGEGENKARNW